MHYHEILSFFNSKPIQLELKDNVIPGLSNETISIQNELFGTRIISKAGQFNSLNNNYRTFTISFGNHLTLGDRLLPQRAIFFATSFKNSFGYKDHHFGAPYITEILMNHHTKVSYKVMMNQRSKEKHPDCVEKTSLEVLEELFVPIVIQNCRHPCTHVPLPNNLLELCDYIRDFDMETDRWNPDPDTVCSMKQKVLADAEFIKTNYSFKPCNIEEFEGKLLEDEIIDGMHDIYNGNENTDILVPYINNPALWNDSQIPTIKFSYTFARPEMATLLVEDFIVTFEDLVGIVGGTLGMFIGFAFYDNIMTSVEYIIAFVQWVKRMNLKRRSRKVVKAQVLEDPSTKKIEAKSDPRTTKVVVETKEKDIHTTLPKERTKVVKENETKKILVTKGNVGKPKPTTVKVVDETTPKNITSSKNPKSKNTKVNESNKILKVILVCAICSFFLSIFIGHHIWLINWIISSATTNTSGITTTSQDSSSACDYKGDGYCDDENNNANCEFDGGDCCRNNLTTTYCTQCQCLDPAYSGCDFPDFKSDDSCDDENNNANCEYDGGDCCGFYIDTNWCLKCQCLDPQGTDLFDRLTLDKKNCYRWSKGDGNCDDENNRADCEYDGGDCCGDNVGTTWCTLCQCLDPQSTHFNQSLLCNPLSKGDGYCEDGNNNPDCEYDGGDCCGDNVDALFAHYVSV